MEALRRSGDGELCGHVEKRDEKWVALTVFGAVLGSHDERASAVDHVLTEGLSSLAERWTLRHGESGAEEVVCIQEVNDAGVTVARGYYSLPGVPTLTITKDQIAVGEWDLYLDRSATHTDRLADDDDQPEVGRLSQRSRTTTES